MNDLLVILAAVLAGLHQNEDRVAVLSFSVPLLLYGMVDELIPEDMGLLYHLGATSIDLMIIFYLSRLIHPSELIVNIQKACEAFIYINLLGWVAYMRYKSPEAYNYTCSFIYIWTLIKIISGSGGWRELRDFTMDRWSVWVHSSDYSGNPAPNTN